MSWKQAEIVFGAKRTSDLNFGFCSDLGHSVNVAALSIRSGPWGLPTIPTLLPATIRQLVISHLTPLRVA
jgi:hypothetical protein